ncbi:MAG: hypothetical protein HY084_05070 [Gemmatimonadetes bacterium]|nr:hypothetical protein [Gemmatimonadota bacterium]
MSGLEPQEPIRLLTKADVDALREWMMRKSPSQHVDSQTALRLVATIDELFRRFPNVDDE